MKKLIIIVLILLLIGGLLIKLSNDLDLKKENDKKTFVDLFTKWLFKVAENVKSVIGYAVKQDWSPVNQTKNA